MITESFSAEKQADGSVTIMCKIWSGTRGIKIPKEDCAELARLLMGPVVSESHKVDYTLSVNEPE